MFIIALLSSGLWDERLGRMGTLFAQRRQMWNKVWTSDENTPRSPEPFGERPAVPDNSPVEEMQAPAVRLQRSVVRLSRNFFVCVNWDDSDQV